MQDHNALLPLAILLFSVLDSGYEQKRYAQLGVEFILQKPCSMEYIVRYLADILMSRRFPEFPDNDALLNHLLG